MPSNESHNIVYAKIKYAEIKIDTDLNGSVGHLNMDGLVYPEVITVRACIEDYHFKLGTDKFNECYREIG